MSFTNDFKKIVCEVNGSSFLTKYENLLLRKRDAPCV